LHSCSLASTSVHFKSLYCKSSIDTWIIMRIVQNG
jgi:hypothetical protein